MKKLIAKALSYRRPGCVPFAIEISAESIRLAVYGAEGGFEMPPTAQTFSHEALDMCLLEGIDLLERCNKKTRETVSQRRLAHRCVFRHTFVHVHDQRTIVLERRHSVRSVPRSGDEIRWAIDDPRRQHRENFVVAKVEWHLHDDEILVYGEAVQVRDYPIEAFVEHYLDAGWSKIKDIRAPGAA